MRRAAFEDSTRTACAAQFLRNAHSCRVRHHQLEDDAGVIARSRSDNDASARPITDAIGPLSRSG
jgi:hypothetical protein